MDLSLLGIAFFWMALAGLFLSLLKSNPAEVSKNRNFYLLALFLLGALFPAITKVIFYSGREFATSDEVLLRFSLSEFETNGKLFTGLFTSHSSGPLFVLILSWIQDASGLSQASTVFFVGLLLSAILPLSVFFMFRSFGSDDKTALGAAAFSFLSSYYLWPSVELRPQLLGMTMLFMILGLVARIPPRPRLSDFVITSLLILPFGMLHLFSFILLLPAMAVVVLYSAYKNDSAEAPPYRPAVLSFVWAVGFLVSTSFMYGVIDDMRWVFSHRVSTFLPEFLGKVYYFDPPGLVFLPLLVIPLLLFIAAFFLASFLVVRFRAKIRGYSDFLLALFSRHRTLLYTVFSSFAMVALLLQIVRHSAEILYWYPSIPAFVLLQSPNVLLIVLAIIGLISSVRAPCEETTLPFLVVSMWGSFFAFALLSSFFLRYGFDNFELRTLNYLVVFFAFFAFSKICDLGNSKIATYAVLAVLLLFPLSAIGGSRHPGFFKNSHFNFIEQSDRQIVDNSRLDLLSTPAPFCINFQLNHINEIMRIYYPQYTRKYVDDFCTDPPRLWNNVYSSQYLQFYLEGEK